MNEFNLVLRPGVRGLLGPNGADKTTLMSILAITRATAGQVLWNGVDVASKPDTIRSVLGICHSLLASIRT